MEIYRRLNTCWSTVQESQKEALLCAAANGSLEVVQYLLSSKGGASITETDNNGNTALLLAAGNYCHPSVVQWLLEHGDAQITDIDNKGKLKSVFPFT